MNKELSFESEWIRLRPTKLFLLHYMRDALGVEEVTWDMLTTSNLATIADYISDRVCGNSCQTYFANIKAFINRFKDDDLIPCRNPEKVLKAKREPQQNIALNADEIHRIEEYYDSLFEQEGRQEEKDVLTLFLLEMYCGARSCDVEKLTENNIREGKLTYVSQKTRILATIPAHKKLPELLERKPRRSYQQRVKNRIIKRVAMKCGIDTPLTLFYHGEMRTEPKYYYCGTHTARRSFASVLAEKGVPIPEIQQYMSHTNVSMTERYIKVDTQRVSDAAMAFLNG